MRADGAPRAESLTKSWILRKPDPHPPLHDVVHSSIHLREGRLAFARHRSRAKRGWSQSRVHAHDKLQDHPSPVRAVLAVRDQHLRILANLPALVKLLL